MITNNFEYRFGKYLRIGNVNQRINAKSNYNSLNINYLWGNVLEYLRIGAPPITDAPAIYSRGCGNWKLYHK